MNEKLIYLSLGILVLVGILLTGVLIQRARGFEKQAARIEDVAEMEVELKLSPTVVEASPAMTFKIPEASTSNREASPSANF